MAITVSGTDGQEFEFPDGTTSETMKAAMRKHYGAPGAANAQQKPNYLQSIGNAFTGAVKQVGQDFANPTDTTPQYQKPIGQQIYDMTAAPIVNGIKTAGDVMNVVNAPLTAAAHPVGAAISNALYDHGIKPNSIPTLTNPMAQPQQLSRSQAADQMTNDLMTAASLAAPERGPGVRMADIPPMVSNVPPADISKPTLRAIQMAKADMSKSPVTFAQNMQANPDSMFAEAAGPNAMTRVKALGNMRDAGVGDQIASTMADRVAGTAPRINTALYNQTGFDPAMGEANIDSIVKLGQAKAAPIYDRFYQQELDSPTLRNLIQSRPDIQASLEPAARNMRNAGLDPSYTNTSISLPDSLPTGQPIGNAASYMQDARDIAGNGQKQAIRSDGPTLNEFIASRGGINDTGGDLANIQANSQTYNRGVGLGKIIKSDGRGLDDMARAATDAGYFREEPSQNDFMAAIQRELSGGSVRMPISASGGADRARYLSGLQQRIDQIGTTGNKPADIAQALANDDALNQHWEDAASGLHSGLSPEAVQERLPTAQHLDYAKRVLDDKIQSAIKNGETEKMRGLLSAKNALVDEMTRLSPDYFHALDVSGDYLSAKDAFSQAPKQFMSPQVTPKQYAENIGSLNRANKDANLQGITSHIYNRLNAKDGAPNSLDFLTSPNAQQKLTIAANHISPDAGSKIYQEIQNAAQMRSNARFMTPRQGSATQPLLSAEKDISGDVGMGKIPLSKGELLGAMADKVTEPIRQLAYKFQLGQSRPVLQEYTRLLLQRGDLTMDEIAKLPDGSFKAFLKNSVRTSAATGGAGILSQKLTFPSPPLLTSPTIAATPPRKKDRKK